MPIYFTFEDGQLKHRSRYIRGALLKYGYKVLKRIPTENSPQSVWFHGLSYDKNRPFQEDLIPKMKAFEGKLVFFKNDDDVVFNIEKIPEHLRNRAFFLRNHWPADPENIPDSIKEKTGFINPLLPPLKANKGRSLNKREISILFYGTQTGGLNIDHMKNSRVEALRAIKKSGIPLKGGLVYHADYIPPEDLTVPAIPKKKHAKLLKNSKICLALWGNCPLTYRLFEGLASRCLVFVQSLSAIRFIHCGLTENVHYVGIKSDLSDLIDKINHYLKTNRWVSKSRMRDLTTSENFTNFPESIIRKN